LKVSVIIPAYNEEKRIIDRIQRLVKHFDKTLEEYEVLIVADGCTDKTSEVVSEHADENPKVKLLNFPERLGKGGAIIEGFKLAGGDTIVVTDADDSVPA
jgi:glycosyltransferase involved in cell wall biosynthesis